MEIIKELLSYKRTSDKILLDSRVKYTLFSDVLDILLHHNCHKGKGMSKEAIYTNLKQRATYDFDCNVTLNQIVLWLNEMILLKFITEDENDLIKLTDDGFKACQDQRFNTNRVVLYESKYSRRISIISLWIAVLSFTTSIIALIISAHI